MLKPSFLALFLATTALATALAQTTQPTPLPLPQVNNGRLTELAAQIVLVHDVPGLGIAVVDSSGLYAFGVAGVRRAGSPDRLTTEDSFHLGACTKVMTAILLGRLHDAHKLSLTDPLSKLLPNDKLDPAFKSITLLDLLQHRSGIPASADDDQLPFLRANPNNPKDARAHLARRVLALAPAGQRTFNYADTNYALAAYVAETLTGSSYEDLMQQELFTPLDMTTAGFGPPKGTNQPSGHRFDSSPVEDGPFTDLPSALNPAGTVHCSLRDWSRFTAVLLGGGPKDFLKPETLALLTIPPANATPPYAAGLALTSTRGNPTLSHTGSNGYWFAQLHVFTAPPNNPATGGWALLITTNQAGDHGEKAINEVTQEILALSK